MGILSIKTLNRLRYLGRYTKERFLCYFFINTNHMEYKSKTYVKENFQNIQYLQQNLRDREYTNCIFKKCIFDNCDLSNSIFIDCLFLDCNLSNTKINNCSFQEVVFEKCKLLGIRFATIDTLLITWIFKESIITICDFSYLDIKESKFLKCEMKEVDFINTNLIGADFNGSSLPLCKFHNTNLEKANFLGALNYYINPIENKLKQAKFSYPDVLSLLDTFEIKIEY